MFIHRRAARGYTLVELIISTALASIVVGGLSSSLYMAAQSLDTSTTTVDSLQADLALATLHRDAQTALSFVELTDHAVSMTVPDRTGDGLTDTLNYSWTGTVGDPLTVSLNGGEPSIVASKVRQFSLAPTTRLIEGVATRPIVLFVSSQPPNSSGVVTPTADEQLRIDLFDDWGYDTHAIGQSQATGEFGTQFGSANVVYVPATVDDAALGGKLDAAPIGVVTELLPNATRLGLLKSADATRASRSVVRIDSAAHYVTEVFAVGEVSIASQSISLNTKTGTVDYQARTLTSVNAPPWKASLLTIESGHQLASGAAAPARRAMLPWGYQLDFNHITATGHTLMRRTIEWAAGAGAVETVNGVRFESFAQSTAFLSTQSINVGIPSGTTAGDLLVATVAIDGAPTNIQFANAGWVPLSVTDQAGQVTLGVWWKLAGSSESTCQFTWTSYRQAVASVLRFSGHDLASPINQFALGGGVSNAPTAPAVTTSRENCMILRLGAFDGGTITAGSTGLANHTDIYMNRSSILLAIASAGAAHTTKVATGTITASNFALTASEQWRTISIAIAPSTSTP